MREQLLAAEQIIALDWQPGVLRLLDQRVLPHIQRWLECRDAGAVAAAIRDMVVRGAPAIGIAAAYGVALAARQHLQSGALCPSAFAADLALLAASRPTAVNLFWALARMQACVAQPGEAAEQLQRIEQEAIAIHREDREANLRMAELGAALIRRHHPHPQALLTHCNAGALATGGFGTALGVIRAAALDGLVARVHADETRPWLQGARLTAWELACEGIPVALNADAAAAYLMQQGDIRWVIVGADRITACGDVANKIGTYQLAVCAAYHGVRVMVVAPTSTIDMSIERGEDIPIEQRSGEELLRLAGQPVAAEVEAINPVFDVTPARLIDALVTERGVIERPDRQQLQQLMASGATR